MDQNSNLSAGNQEPPSDAQVSALRNEVYRLHSESEKYQAQLSRLKMQRISTEEDCETLREKLKKYASDVPGAGSSETIKPDNSEKILAELISRLYTEIGRARVESEEYQLQKCTAARRLIKVEEELKKLHAQLKECIDAEKATNAGD